MARSISDNILQMVLAQGNKEQNQHYAPGIFTSHYKLASDWLKGELIKLYPTSQTIVDILGPYIAVELIQVVNGKIALPKLYRDLLGIGFYVNDLSGKKKCEIISLPSEKFKDPKNPTLAEIEKVTAEMQVESKGIDMKTIGEWNYITDHPYKRPKTFDKAKGCIFDNNTLKVLPLAIPYVEVRFIKVVPEFYYGYRQLPDDTCVFDPDTTIEELWTETAIPYLFKGVNKLFANYIRDTEYIASAKDLQDNSLF